MRWRNVVDKFFVTKDRLYQTYESCLIKCLSTKKTFYQQPVHSHLIEKCNNWGSASHWVCMFVGNIALHLQKANGSWKEVYVSNNTVTDAKRPENDTIIVMVSFKNSVWECAPKIENEVEMRVGLKIVVATMIFAQKWRYKRFKCKGPWSDEYYR